MKKYRALALAVAGGLALSLSACGSDAEPAAQAADGELEKTEVSVGVLPLADYATVYWAEDHGFFEKEGLDVTLEPLQGGPVGVEKVAAGELDFSFSNSISASIAQSKGTPVSTVVLGSALGPDSMGVFVNPDSDITSLEDLDGITLGVNTTNNVGDVAFNNLTSEKGVDVEPEWVEVPFGEMIAGVKADSIEAGYVPEPFKSDAEAAGLREVVSLSDGPNADLPVSNFIASDSFVAENADTTAAFAKAMYAANKDLTANEKEFRAWLPDVAGVDQKTAETMSIPTFIQKTDVGQLNDVADLLKEQGLVPDDFDAADHTFVPEK